MQAISVAVSPTGLDYLLGTLLGDQIAQALEQNLIPPDYSTTFPTWSVPHIQSSVQYTNYTLSLGNGRFTDFTPVLNSYTQDGQNFTITMVATNPVVDYTWNENGTMETYIRGIPEGPCSIGPTNWPYTIVFATFTVTATFALAFTNGAYQVTYVSSTCDPGSPDPNIPSGSVLNTQQLADCGFSTRISDATVQQLETIDFGASVAAALQPVLASIPGTGVLGDVTFDFAPGDSPLTFPAGGGLQVGVTGLVEYNGTAYDGTPPAGLALPPVPGGSPAPHVQYSVQDYEFNALFWGENQAGSLTANLTAGDLSDPQALETNTYGGTTLNALCAEYPDAVMTATLSATAAPSVSFQTTYEITAANLLQIQTALGPTVWNAVGASLGTLTTSVFATQQGFEAALELANSELPAYEATIEQYAAQPGVVLTQAVKCTLNVLQSGSPTPVLTFDVAQTFVMQSPALGVAGTTQTLQFAFALPRDSNATATFVWSSIAGIDNGDFGYVWGALTPQWNDVLTAVGTTGVPLPRIQGYNFVFELAQIAIVAATATADGYATVTANVQYESS